MDRIRNGIGRGLRLMRGGRGLFLVLVLAFFLAGYGLASSMVGRCMAQTTPSASAILPDYISPIGNNFVPPPASTPCPCYITPLGLVPPPSLCVYPTQTEDMVDWLDEDLRDFLGAAAAMLESFIGDWLIDGMMLVLLETLNQAELNLIDWWDTFWFYNLNPAMQDMVKQISVGYADQVRAIQTSIDGQQGGESQKIRKRIEAEARKTYQPSESAGVVATMVGGIQRASTLGASMQKALQDEALSLGLAQVGTPAAAGAAAAERERYNLFRRTFCDPNSNGGMMNCAGSGYPNIDTQPTKQIFSRLTIPLIGSSPRAPATASADPGFGGGSSLLRAAAAASPTLPAVTGIPQSNQIPVSAVSAILDNMVGVPAMDPIPLASLESASGQERFLRRRSYLARYAAVRNVPQMIVGRRMPGSQLGPWVAELRSAAGVPPSEISDNPSYREIMHAMTIDRFNSGKFATGMITDQSVIEREKLIMSSLFLMQLRDYYELLERTALTLAVQVAIMADETELPAVRHKMPK